MLLAFFARALANAPSVADLDAAARATGNRHDVAVRIGSAIFRTEWPAEVNQVSANAVGNHLIVGVRIWGVKFHRPLTQAAFAEEIAALADRIFATVPEAEEIDFWASVPITVKKGEVVSGDLAKPTSRTVFSLTLRRSERRDAMRGRLLQGGDDVYWDGEWVRDAFEPARGADRV